MYASGVSLELEGVGAPVELVLITIHVPQTIASESGTRDARGDVGICYCGVTGSVV